MMQIAPSSPARGKAGKVETPKHRIRHHKSKGALPWNWPPPRHHPNPGHLLLVGFASARKAEAHTEPRGDAASKPEHAMRLARATPGLSTSQPTPRSGKHSQGENQERRRRTHASKSRRRPAKQGGQSPCSAQEAAARPPSASHIWLALQPAPPLATWMEPLATVVAWHPQKPDQALGVQIRPATRGGPRHGIVAPAARPAVVSVQAANTALPAGQPTEVA